MAGLGSLTSLEQRFRDGQVFPIFVYGSLKLGHENYLRFCPGTIAVSGFYLPTALYLRQEGFPEIYIEQKQYFCEGSADIAADTIAASNHWRRHLETATQELSQANRCSALLSHKTFGELLLITDPKIVIPKLDDLEDFIPCRPQGYRRVFCPVFRDGTAFPAWTYSAIAQPRQEAVLDCGIWIPQKTPTL